MPLPHSATRRFTDHKTVNLAKMRARLSGVSAQSLIFSEEESKLDPILLQDIPQDKLHPHLEALNKRYSLTSLLATGGFAYIYTAEDQLLGQDTVVKTLKKELRNDTEVTEKFIREARLTAQLDHPAIAPVYGISLDDSQSLNVSMPHIHGITLKEYLKRTREIFEKEKHNQAFYETLLKKRLEIFLRVCEAISYCHNRQIIHCDLKPENIMIARYGRVYVMDWGIATANGSIQQGNLSGTPAYLAPERIKDRISTPQTDIFSLGMILNEIATLRVPLIHKNPYDTIQDVLAGNFPPSTPVFPQFHLSDVLRAIIEKARNYAPEKRYQTTGQLTEDIRHYLFHEETSAMPYIAEVSSWKR